MPFRLPRCLLEGENQHLFNTFFRKKYAFLRVFQTFDGKELYPTKEEKGAGLGYTLISNHAFLDGNKRIGMHVMLTFLEVNGIRIKCSSAEIVEVGLGVASGRMTYENLLEWVLKHRAF